MIADAGGDHDAEAGDVLAAKLDFADVTQFFMAKGKGDVKEWPEGRRTMALQWLTSDAGHQNFNTWLSERGNGMPDFDAAAG